MGNDKDLSIPRWFVRLASGAIMLAVPWAAWVTVQLISIGVRLDGVSQTLPRFESHVADSSIHREGLLRLRAAVDAMQQRLDCLEGRIGRQNGQSP